jgi:probable phosphoglycerate mutase
VEVILIRHAIPVRRELESGAADPELSAQGVRQAELLAEYLSFESLDAIYSSPMLRAQQTAAPLASLFSLGISLVDGVAEFDRHSEWYVPVEELKAANDPRWHELVSGEWTATHETEEQFISRVTSAIETIISDHGSQRVAIVCHGGVINAYIASILGVGNKRGFFYPNYTSIHRVAAARSGERSVVTLNETSHLRGSGLPIGLFQK